MATMVTVSLQPQVKPEVNKRFAELAEREGLTTDEAVGQMINRAVSEGVLPIWGADSAEDVEDGYPEWLDAKLQQAIDNPGPGIPHEEVRRRMEVLRAEARSRLR